MPRKRFKTEEIIQKLREAEVLLSLGRNVSEACRQIGVTDNTNHPGNSKRHPLNSADGSVVRHTKRYTLTRRVATATTLTTPQSLHLVDGEEGSGTGRYPIYHHRRGGRLPRGRAAHSHHRTDAEWSFGVRGHGASSALRREDDDALRSHRHQRPGAGSRGLASSRGARVQG